MHRYDINFIMSMDFEDVMEMYSKARKENLEAKLWQQWLVDYARMDGTNFLSFENYKKKSLVKENNININVKNILEEAEKIKLADQKGGM